MAERTARAVWQGGLFDGEGTFWLESSGMGQFEISWPRRAEGPEGVTSPEELLAAAHASCFCMALSLELAQAGGTNARLVTTGTVTLVPGTGITKVELGVEANVDGLDPEEFDAAVEKAKDGCPVSGLFRGGSAEIVVNGTLASPS